MLDENQLRDEIGFLRRTLRTKQRLALMRANHNLQLSSRPTNRPHEHSSVKISLLMDWVRAVCDFYQVKVSLSVPLPYLRPFQTSNLTEAWVDALCAQVENFTVAFSDGRVLCYLIHHYHPSLLSDKAVSLLTTQTVECSLRGRLELDCSASGSDSSFDSLPAGLNGTRQLSYVTLQLFLHFKIFVERFPLLQMLVERECKMFYFPSLPDAV